MSYSLDLRYKVIEARKGGATVSAIMKLFSIARETVYIWLRKYEQGLSLASKEWNRVNTRKVDYNQLVEYVKNNPDKYLWEIGKHFSIATSTVDKILKKLKISYKKKPSLQKKR